MPASFMTRTETCFLYKERGGYYATPGDTPGHISLSMEQDSIIITGDAIALEGDIPVIANPQFTLDIEQAARSMDKLLSIKTPLYSSSDLILDLFVPFKSA